MAKTVSELSFVNASLIESRSGRRLSKKEDSERPYGLSDKTLGHMLSVMQGFDMELEPEKIQDYDNITAVCHSNQEAIVGGCPSGLLIIWKNGNRAMHYNCRSSVNIVTHGQKHARIYAGLETGEIVRWAYTKDNNALIEITKHKAGVTHIILFEEDTMMISASRDGKMYFWYLTAKKKPIEFHEHQSEITSLQLHDDETKFLTSSIDGEILLWSLEIIESIHVLHRFRGSYGIEHIELNGNTFFATDTKGILAKWSLEDYSVLHSVELPSKVVSMCKSNDRRYLFLILQSAIEFSIKVVTIDKFESEKIFTIPNAHTQQVNAVRAVPKGNKVITSSKDGSIKIWDFDEKYDTYLVINRNIDINCIAANESLNLIVCGDTEGKVEMYTLGGKKLERELKTVTKCEINTIAFTNDLKYVAVGCEDQRILLWHAKGFAKEEWIVFKEHSEGITSICISLDSRYLISASSDRTIKIFDIVYQRLEKTLSSNKSDDNSGRGEVAGHKKDVTDVKVTKNYIYSSGADGFVIIWSIKTFAQLKKFEFGQEITTLCPSIKEDCFAVGGKSNVIKIWWDFMHVPYVFDAEGHEGDVIRLIVYGEENFMYSIAKDCCLKIWSLDQGLILFSLKIDEMVNFYVPKEQRLIYVVLFSKENNISTIKKVQNPLFGDNITIYPPHYSYFFKTYVKKIQSHETKIYDSYWQDYMIFPHCVNLAYSFIFANRPNLLKQSFAQGMKFLKSKAHESPLSWALFRNNSQCADVILKKLSKISLKHQRVIIEAVEKEMNQLISRNLTCLPLLYENLFEVLTENVDAAGKLKKKAPMIAISDDRILCQDDFFDRSSSLHKKEFLEFRMSLCRFQLELGSIESLKLLGSITDCHNSELFKTQLLKAFLTFKWRQNFYILILETLLYCTNLTFLTIFVINSKSGNQSGILSILLLLNSLNLIQNGTKCYYSIYRFFRSTWNILDLCRLILSFFFIFYQFTAENPEDFGLELLTLCYWLKAMGYFRIFNKYRYLLRVIMEIIKDMTPFFLILFTSTIAFAILLCVSQDGISFYNSFVNLYLLDQTNFVIKLDSFENDIVFFLASLLNPIIMLNLLIAIMGDTYDRVQEDQIVADYREMTELILEAEYLAFWRRSNKGLLMYITRCDYMRNLNLEKNQWMGKIKAVKKSLQILEGKFKSTSRTIDSVQFNLLDRFNEVVTQSSILSKRLKDIK
ncbi:hypothetical protein SteCoe_14837 [Stentor coeruleus]|uniref:Ion transport domain-containing protein n=1 Tax=Stentor coeruleus TaxID=5963 RepID=A0A1R2C4Y3_9CILI|nr:hypothetical protein SteCoe_14837 [Stentor coeruleus]